jgi:hypothetical protein
MIRLLSKFTGIFLVFALVIASNHCFLESVAGALMPAEHPCPVDGATQPHGGACRSVISTVVKNQSVALEAVYSLELTFFTFSTRFLSSYADLYCSRPQAWRQTFARSFHSSFLTQILALAPNAPPYSA